MTTSHPSYNRTVPSTGKYYYDPIPIIVDKSGLYRISTNTDDIYLYAYLYNTTFDHRNATRNLITSAYDTDTVPNLSFSINLQTQILYTLVITTYYSDDTGLFNVTVTGPGNAIVVSSLTTTVTTDRTATTTRRTTRTTTTS